MEKVKLLPEQVKYIEERVKELEEHIKEIRECLVNGDSSHVFSSDNQGFDGIPDLASFNELGRAKAELAELTKILRTAEIVKGYNEEQIEVGTKFVATLKFAKQGLITEKYILIDFSLNPKLNIDEYKPVSVNSPFGMAIRSKKANETILYATPNNEAVVGLIDEIIPAQQIARSENIIKLAK